MQKEFKIIVAVNNEEHTELIRKDLEEAIQKRTTVFFVSEAEPPSISISQMYENRHTMIDTY